MVYKTQIITKINNLDAGEKHFENSKHNNYKNSKIAKSPTTLNV